MPIMEVKILPIGTSSASVSEHIAKVAKLLDQDRVKHQLTPMGTIIEAESVERLLEMAGKMHKSVLAGVNRVVTFIELDDRKDKPLTMEGKLASVKRFLDAA